MSGVCGYSRQEWRAGGSLGRGVRGWTFVCARITKDGGRCWQHGGKRRTDRG